MKSIDIQDLHEITSDLSNFRHKNYKNKIETIVLRDSDEVQDMGGYGLSYEIYSFPKDPELFIRLTIKTDSYGKNEYVSGIEFVTRHQELKTIYK